MASQGPSITAPNPVSVPENIATNKRVRSRAARAIKADQQEQDRFNKFLKFAPVIKLPIAVQDLEKPLSAKEKMQLDWICENELGVNHPTRCTSAQYVDKNGTPILFYLGKRLIFPNQKQPALVLAEDQYKGELLHEIEKIVENNLANMFHDGLHPEKCKHYQLAVQSLCATVKPHRTIDNTRYEGAVSMIYPSRDSTDSESEADMVVDSGFGSDLEELDEVNQEAYDLDTKTEKAGVLHLSHGWIQRGQKKKGLYISGDISRTSTTLQACGSHYYLTEPIAKVLGNALKATFPEWYEKYQKAFQAGVWFPDDPGPFFARAIIYKLQGRLHKDNHDMGPSVSFPVGQYTGGEMIFPQLKTKLLYAPGDACIFYSSMIYHKVAKFYPKEQTVAQAAQQITPGRIGSVFFFPKVSYDVLKDKPQKWGYRTGFGKEGLLSDYTGDEDNK